MNYLTQKFFNFFQKCQNFDQNFSKILSVNFFCKIRKISQEILSIVLNFHDVWIRIADFLLIETFLGEAAYLVATRQTSIVTRNNFAPTSTYIYHNFCLLHRAIISRAIYYKLLTTYLILGFFKLNFGILN